MSNKIVFSTVSPDPSFECSICYQGLEDPENDENQEVVSHKVSDTVSHQFHKDCLKRWFSRPNSTRNCPLCRKEIDLLSFKTEPTLREKFVTNYSEAIRTAGRALTIGGTVLGAAATAGAFFWIYQNTPEDEDEVNTNRLGQIGEAVLTPIAGALTTAMGGILGGLVGYMGEQTAEEFIDNTFVE